MPLILGTNSIKDTGYDVANSVRLNAGDNPSGTITQGTPTNVDKYTFSVWVKRADIGAGNSKIFSVQGSNANVEEKLEFNNDDIIWRQTEASAGNTTWERVTDRKFRDPSAWYHIVVAYDSSQGTAGDRCKMYINGVQETSFSGSSDPSSNLDSVTNTSGRALKFFASCFNVNNQNAGAYFAEMVYVDGQQLDPTSFGEFDSDSPNIWKPIDVSGLTFGNNGFYLDFEDSSALGNDVSGNNNDVTFSNIASTDQSTDTCTNNYCTLNPLSRNAGTFANGNCSQTGGNDIASTIGVTTGKWYWEVKRVDSNTVFHTGICSTNKGMNGVSEQFLNGEASSIGGAIYISNGNTGTVSYSNGAGFSSVSYNSFSTVSISSGDILGFALDLDSATKQLNVYQNGSSIGNVTFNYDEQNPIFVYSRMNTSVQGDFNFGNPPFSISSGNSDGNGYGNFEYSVPSGYYALNTKNLAEFG